MSVNIDKNWAKNNAMALTITNLTQNKPLTQICVSGLFLEQWH